MRSAGNDDDAIRSSDLRRENVSVSVRVEDDDEHDESLARRHREATHDIRRESWR